MTTELEAAVAAFLVSQEAAEEQVRGAAIRLSPMTDDPELSILVDYGIKGTKHFKVSVAELLEQQQSEPENRDDSVLVWVPDPLQSADPDLIPEPETAQMALQNTMALELAGIQGVSPTKAHRIIEAGVDTWAKLTEAVQDRSLLAVSGVGETTLAGIGEYLEQVFGVSVEAV